MRRLILVVILGLCVFLGGYLAGHVRLNVVHAQANVPTINIPKAWGRCVGTMQSPMGVGLLFEDSSGNLYMSDISGRLQATFVRN